MRMRAMVLFSALVLSPSPAAMAETHRTIPNPRTPTVDGVVQGVTPSAADASLGSDRQITEARVTKVLQALRADPEGAKLADEALKHAQDTTGGPFWKVVEICPSSLDPNTLGQASSGTSVRIPFVRDIEEAALNPSGSEAFFRARYKDRIAATRKQGSVPDSSPDLVQVFPDVACIKTYQTPPSICLRADLTVTQASSVLQHELVHYNAMDWRKQEDALAYDSKQDYELKKVMSPGDEVDAYVSEWGHDIRLSGKSAVPELVEPYFRDNGSFIPKGADGSDNRAKLARLILDGPIFVGQGYALGRFRAEYPELLNGERSFQSGFVQLFGSLHDNRQANVPFYQQQVARDPNGAAYLKEDQAAIPRLLSEQSSCQAKVAKLDELIEKFKEWDSKNN